MIELILVLIAITFIVYFTVDFIVSIKRDKVSLIVKIWRWLKNILDAIWGIG
jgi:hypothetical protein